ncbi:MAG: Lrp/AsnC family transcriptional regulator [Oscillospiraceae bacterium]|nr:Lrp/AsnC family transcriptional regulator [Oscillospiraceae bacterium]
MEQLLRLLENNARLSENDLGAMLDKTPAEIHEMMELAKAKGYIRGYKTLVNWEKLGSQKVQAVIELCVTPKKSHGFDDIALTIAAFDEVESVLLMSGGYDLQLIIGGRSFHEVALFVAKRLSPLDDVRSTATHFVLRTYKKDGEMFLEEDPDERECTVL